MWNPSKLFPVCDITLFIPAVPTPTSITTHATYKKVLTCGRLSWEYHTHKEAAQKNGQPLIYFDLFLIINETYYQITPCATIALATFINPATLAPFT